MRIPRPSKKIVSAFTLVEVVMALAILGLVFSGLLYGYVQSNRMAEWTSMSLAAESFAMQGAERARAADWDEGAGIDEMPAGYFNKSTDFIDLPMTGRPAQPNVTNLLTISTVTASGNVQLRQIRSDCIWAFPLTGKVFTNTIISYRSPDR